MALVQFNLSGVSVDLPPWRVPPDMWTQARGVTFRDAVASREPGSVYQYGSALGPLKHLFNSDFAGLNYWLYGLDDGVGVVQSDSTHFDITPAGWPATTSKPDAWTSTSLNGVPVMNYDTQAPIWWDRDVGNVMTELPGWPTGALAYSMRTFKDFLLAIGYYDGSQDFPDQLVWSDAADPGLLPTEWTATAENLAGSLEFGDTPGGLIDGASLRGNFIVYKQSATYLLQFVGAPFVFSRRKLFTTSGALSRNCIAEVEGNHVVFTDSDVVIHDGQQLRSLVDARTREFIFRNLDQTEYQNSYVMNFKSRDEVWVCFPTTGQKFPDLALVWNTDHNKLSFRDLRGEQAGFPHIAYGNVSEDFAARTWDTQSYTWDGGSADYVWNSNLSINAVNGALAADDLKFQSLDRGETAAAGNIQVELRRDSLDFGDPNTVKLARRVWPRFRGGEGTTVNISIGSQFETDDPINWSTAVPFLIGQDSKIDSFATGRYLSFRFVSTDGGLWEMPGFDVELSEGGGQY